MATIQLGDIAYVRSGDKGRGSNVGVVARTRAAYPILKRYLTENVVQSHFSFLNIGPVDRYELPNIGALNFILHNSLGGGGSESLRTDAQGKTHGLVLLHLEIDITEKEYNQLQAGHV